jgi:hypothetical protein
MMKFYPLVLLPALWWRGNAPTGSAWKMPAALAGVIAFGYACYASVGMRVFGFLGGYAKEEGLATGARYFLLDLAKRAPGLHVFVERDSVRHHAGCVCGLDCGAEMASASQASFARRD